MTGMVDMSVVAPGLIPGLNSMGADLNDSSSKQMGHSRMELRRISGVVHAPPICP